MMLFPNQGGAASSLIGCCQFALGALVSFITGNIFNEYGVSLFNLSIIILSIVIFLFPTFYGLAKK